MSLYIQNNHGTVISESTVTINQFNGQSAMTVQPQAKQAEDVLVESEYKSERKPGPKKQILFVNPKGEEDSERTHQEAQRFAKYISDHHMGRMRLDSKSHNPLTWLAVCMWYRWKELGWVDITPQGAAMYRFLTETCDIACEVEPRAFTSTFCSIVRSGKKDPEIYDNLHAYFPK